MELIERCAYRIARLRAIGWFDFSSDSYDMRVAAAHAWRIQSRRAGLRITRAQALQVC